MSKKRTSFENINLFNIRFDTFWLNSAVRWTGRTDYSSLEKVCCSYGRRCKPGLLRGCRCARSRWNLRNKRQPGTLCYLSPLFQASAWNLRTRTLPHSRLHRSLKNINEISFLISRQLSNYKPAPTELRIVNEDEIATGKNSSVVKNKLTTTISTFISRKMSRDWSERKKKTCDLPRNLDQIVFYC